MLVCHFNNLYYCISLMLGPDRLRVIFESHELKDDQSLGFYKIRHLDVLFTVLKMPGGGPQGMASFRR